MINLFYKKDYKLLLERLDEVIARLETDKNCYHKLITFLVVAEDRRYYHHPGFDVIGICRAIYRNLFLSKREGASTIEQQLVRVLTGDYRYSYQRKIKEIYLASKLRHIADKQTLAASYLEVSNYGTIYHGLSSILQKFAMDIHQELSDEVCAEVIARLKYPEPRIMTTKRALQIEERKRYILYLYDKPSNRRHD